MEEKTANRELDEARAIGESYGVAVIPRLRARAVAQAPRSFARRRAAAARSSSSVRRARISAVASAPSSGSTVDYVLKNAPCRVLVTALPEAP